MFTGVEGFGDVERVVIARVEATHANVLMNIYGEGEKNIQITQSSGGFTGEYDNLMRVGGVYILPLRKWGDNYFVWGDLTALFEIDNNGLVYHPFTFFQ
jgi:hypothetical protein